MTANDQMIKLYSQRILRLAANIPHTDRLDAPHASSKKRSPLCGSTVTVDINVDGDTVIGYGQDVKACALGQASASIFGAAVLGQTQSQIQTLRTAVWDMLTNDGPNPTAPFDDYIVLQPAQAYPNRHASILLALDATLDAFEILDKKTPQT
jgi:NifU-like protein involved in Fe-S cluster formation